MDLLLFVCESLVHWEVESVQLFLSQRSHGLLEFEVSYLLLCYTHLL